MKSYVMFLLIVLFMCIKINLAQEFSPYPIIFVHGLNSDDNTWQETLDILSPIFGSSQVFHSVQNAYSGLRKLEGFDGVLGTNDDDVLFPVIDDESGDSINQLQIGSLFAVNFENFWNEDSFNPRIDLYSNSSPGFDESDGNESAIYKQGFALKKCIEKVLAVTKSEKVILVGHSMGGLAIREYLQRMDENGKRKWWIDTIDQNNGHRVIKVVTIGTPHGGSDGWAFLGGPLGVNLFSEAVRDLRATFDNEVQGVYLFGGNESSITGHRHNKDLNCNGNENDDIIGISEIYNNILGISHLIPSTTMPLPNKVSYTWIVSANVIGGDEVVTLERQWLYNSDKIPLPIGIADTLNTDRNHLFETSDFKTIIRGLDEPQSLDLAYTIKSNDVKKGFITYQNGYSSATSDIDIFKIVIDNDGFLTLKIDDINDSGIQQIAILDSLGTNPPLIFSSTSSLPTAISYPTSPGTYHLRVRGFATNNFYESPYIISTLFQKLDLLNPVTASSLLADSLFNISWSSKNISNIKIELTTDNGITWVVIVNGISASLGTYSWIVPRSISNQCRIRISDASNPEIFRESSESFAIVAPLKIVEPNGLENWSAYSTKKIKWGFCGAESVKLELTTDNGLNWIIITESIQADQLEFNWTVNNILSTSCRIKITNGDNPTDSDISDNLFTISGQNFWSSNSNNANPICNATNSQLGQKIISDGNGGAIIVWADSRSGNYDDIFAQKINSKGITQWTVNGVLIQSKPSIFYGTGHDFSVVSDGNGGAIISWIEAYSPGSYMTYHYTKAQRISADGTLLWDTDGIPICTASLDRKNVCSASDGNGGAIITWSDNRNSNWDIYAQRVNSVGTVLWQSNGIAISNSADNQDQTSITDDGIGGGIISWMDFQSGGVSLYAQRINSNGEVLWSDDGIVICSLSVSNNQSRAPSLMKDNEGGAYITWVDTRDGDKIYVQRIDQIGNFHWIESGVAVGSGTNHSNPKLVNDGGNGTIILWLQGYQTLKTQRYAANGIAQWNTGGITLYSNIINSGEIESDAQGGAIISLWKHISYNSEPYSTLAALRINSEGSMQWFSYFNTSKGPIDQKMVHDGSGGVIISFLDREAIGNNYDIYASKINSAGILGGDDIALPVELTSFNSIVSNSNVELKWSTSTETNNYGFDIERRSCFENWKIIGFVLGNGNSNSPKNYSFTDNSVKKTHIYSYRLKQIDTDGSFEYSNEIEVTFLPAKYELYQNYPNPFNPSTTIGYALPNSSKVRLEVFDMLGQYISTLVNTEQPAGYYEIPFIPESLSSGVYFFLIDAKQVGGDGHLRHTRKMLLMK